MRNIPKATIKRHQGTNLLASPLLDTNERHDNDSEIIRRLQVLVVEKLQEDVIVQIRIKLISIRGVDQNLTSVTEASIRLCSIIGDLNVSRITPPKQAKAIYMCYSIASCDQSIGICRFFSEQISTFSTTSDCYSTIKLLVTS